MREHDEVLERVPHHAVLAEIRCGPVVSEVAGLWEEFEDSQLLGICRWLGWNGDRGVEFLAC
jgi:hypothetical protein